jgi:hypothetical protein
MNLTRLDPSPAKAASGVEDPATGPVPCALAGLSRSLEPRSVTSWVVAESLSRKKMRAHSAEVRPREKEIDL